ncbi:Bud site selection protein, Revert to axial protein 1 [Gryganskiella cystojenkinii]|nr:Bud site selection protein, Revert to axial protein 1 [Gryganskiella cystojenkinii]
MNDPEHQYHLQERQGQQLTSPSTQFSTPLTTNMMTSTPNTGSCLSEVSYSPDSPNHQLLPSSSSNNHNRSSSSSSPSRRPPPQHLDAIQTQKAQASVTFRPISSTSSDMVLGGNLELSNISNNSHNNDNHNDGQRQRSSPVTYSEPALPSASTVASGQDIFPFTPSTLVDSVPSPIMVESDFHTIPLSPTRQPHQFPQQQQPATIRLQPQPRQTRIAIGANHPNRSTNSSNNHPYNNNSYGLSKMLLSSSTNGPHQGTQGMDLTYSSSSDDPRFQHLPNLWQVLHRKTLPPVCLFNFYLYMRDYERSSEEVDFWLDVTAHEVLWRLYVRATKRRQALAAAERAEKDHEREAARLEAERWKSQVDEDQEQEMSKVHQKKPSVTLEMYEPHWSAANRYLELSSGGAAGSSSSSPSQTTGQTAFSTPLIPRDLSEPMLFKASATPKSPLSPSTTLGRAYSFNGTAATAGGSSANMIRSLSRPSEGTQELLNDSEGPRSSSGTTGLAATPTPAPIKTAVVPRRAPPIAAAPIISPLRVPSDANLSAKSASNNGSATSSSAAASTGQAPQRRAMTSGMAGVTKEDLQRSAERIYYRYLTPQAEKPVRIPGAVRQRVAALMDSNMMSSMNHPPLPTQPYNTAAVGTHHQYGTSESSHNGGAGMSPTTALKRKNNLGTSSFSTSPHNKDRSNFSNNPNEKSALRGAVGVGTASTMSTTNTSLTQPDQDLGLVFAEAREIVFEGMESYYFPRFLQARAYGNLVHSQRLMRLLLGLFFLFVGFVVVLCLIFLNIRPRSVRAWALIPIFIGIFLCTTFQFNLCPILVVFGVSETKWMQYAKIKEPYIMMLHRRRALKVMAVAVLYTICVGTIFGAVPGHRL